MQSGYSKCAYSLIDQRLLAPACRRPGYVRQVCATTRYSSNIVSYHELLFELQLIDIHVHQNCTGTGNEVHAHTASLSHLRIKKLFHELLMCNEVIHEKTFHGSVLSTKYSNIKLFPNYSISDPICKTRHNRAY